MLLYYLDGKQILSCLYKQNTINTEKYSSSPTSSWELHKALRTHPNPFTVVTFGVIRSLQSWTKVLGHFYISGRFPIHTGPIPPFTPQTMLDTCIQNFFWVSTSYRVGGGRTARKIRRGCTVLWGNPEWKKNMNIALLSPGLLSIIVVLIGLQNCSISARSWTKLYKNFNRCPETS